MTNHDDGYDNGDNDGNEDGKNDENAASGSGLIGLIFYPVATPWSRIGIADEDRAKKRWSCGCGTIFIYAF